VFQKPPQNIYRTLAAIRRKKIMSDIYFCFSDENGDYKPKMSHKQLRRHPFYIRTTLIMNAGEWKKLSRDFRELKESFGLPISKEIKWAYLWNLRHFKKDDKIIPEKRDFKFLEKFDYHELIKFVSKSLELIGDISEKKVIATFTKNDSVPAINEKSILSMHLQEHMQRIEMELQVDDGNLGVLFFDPVSNQKNEMFRQIYNELFESGDFIEKYSFIKDSLNIENSHQSVGIQIADYISGAFSSVLKADYGDYSLGIEMFNKSIKPYLRVYNGNIFGIGIREVPRDNEIRKWVREMIEKTK
jgi:hypothetical protein